MDQEAINVAGTALPDEHLQSAPAGEATKVEAKTEPQTAQSEPAAQPAAPATAQTPPAGNEPQNPDAQPQDAPKKKGGVQTRIDELTRERYEAQRQAEYWRQQAEARATQPTQQPAKPAPKIEDYSDVNQFLEARDAWVMEQAEAKILGRLTEVQQRTQTEQQQHAQQIAELQVQERFRAQEHDARGRYADYDAAVATPLMGELKQVRPDVIRAVIDSPHGPDIAYFLSKNPARTQQIAQLHPIAAAREIGRIEQMFMGQKQTTTQAPPPPRTVGGEAKVALDPSNMTMKEYRAWREKQR